MEIGIKIRNWGRNEAEEAVYLGRIQHLED